MVAVETGGRIIPHDAVTGLSRYQEVNGEHYIDLTTTVELARGDFVRVTSDVDGITREYVVWAVDEPHEMDLLQRTYRCVWSLQAMLSASTSSAMPGTGGTPATARQALTALLQEQGAWAVGAVEPTLRSSASFWRMTAWEGLGELVKTWGGEVDAVYDPSTGARTLSLLDRIGADGAFSFVWGSSEIDSVARRMADGPNVCRIIPIGAASETDSGGYGRKIDITSVNGGVPYIEDAEKAAEYAGLPNPHPTAYVENPEITDPAELKAWGETVLHSVTRPVPEYDVFLVEKYARNDGYVPALGDSGTVVDESLGVELSARVYAVTVDELAGSVKAVCSASAVGLGAMAQLVTSARTSGAVSDATGTTCASLLLTTTGSPYTSGITAYDRGVGGHNVFWRTGGNLVLGSGEFAANMMGGDVESCYSGTGETAWFGSDGALKLVSNANTIANRKTWTLGADGSTTLPAALTVANGGTGRATLASGSYLVGNGTGQVSLKTPAQVLSDIGAAPASDLSLYLPLTGGTLSGALTVNSTIAVTPASGKTWDVRSNGYMYGPSGGGVVLKNGTQDITASSLPSVTDQYIAGGQDKNGNWTGRYRVRQNRGGVIQSRIESRCSGSGGEVENNLAIGVKPDGTRVVSVSEASVWRTALGLGSLATKSSLAASDIPDLGATYLKLTGGTVTGRVSTRYLTVGSADNTETQLSMVTEGRSSTPMRVIDGDADGRAMLIGDGGLTVVGGGEFALNLWGTGDYYAVDEQLHMGADAAVFIHSNGQTIANRKTWEFGSDGHMQAPTGGCVRFKNGTQDSSASSISALTNQNMVMSRDKSGYVAAQMLVRQYTSGQVSLLMEACHRGSGTTWNTLNLGVKPDGSRVVSVSDAAAWRAGIGAAPASDRRLKSKVEPLGGEASRFVRALEPCVYEMHGERQVGLVAQDVHAADPWGTDMAFETDEGLDEWERMEDGSKTWRLDYVRVVPPLVKALQDALDRIDALEAALEGVR